MKIFKVSQNSINNLSLGESGWILANGSIEKVSSMKHLKFIKDKPALFGIVKNEIEAIDNANADNYVKEEDLYELAYLKGAIRFNYIQGSHMDISGKESSIINNLDVIHTIAKTNRINYFYVDTYFPSKSLQFKNIEGLYALAKSNKILKVANVSKAGWILPNGDLIDAGAFRHVELVKEKYGLFGLSKKEVDGIDLQDLKDIVINKGAVRFVCNYGESINIEGAKSAIKKWADMIYSFCKKYSASHIFADIHDNGAISFKSIKASEIYAFATTFKIYKIVKSRIRGEWWIIDGQAIFADAEIGDQNHSGVVIEHILATHDFDADIINLEEMTDEELLKNGLSQEEIDVVRDRVDPRDYGMRHLGWKRVAENNIQTQTLTFDDLRQIGNGIYDIDDSIADDEKFYIEVMGNNRFYSNVPYSAINSCDISQIGQYR